MSSIPPPLGVSGPAATDAQVEYLMFVVDRLKTSVKIITRVAVIAITLGLGGMTGLAGWLYSRGVSDENVRGSIERDHADLSDCKTSLKEIQTWLFPRRLQLP